MQPSFVFGVTSNILVNIVSLRSKALRFQSYTVGGVVYEYACWNVDIKSVCHLCNSLRVKQPMARPTTARWGTGVTLRATSRCSKGVICSPTCNKGTVIRGTHRARQILSHVIGLQWNTLNWCWIGITCQSELLSDNPFHLILVFMLIL